MSDDANMADDGEPVTGAAVTLRRPLAFNRAAIPDAATVTMDELAVTAKRHRRTLDFFKAAEQETPDIANMRRLVSQGIDLGWAESGDAPLHVALRLNAPQLVKELLKAGANASQKTRTGQTPLALAIDLGLGLPGAMLLVQGGADTTATSSTRRSDFALSDAWKGTGRCNEVPHDAVHDALHAQDIPLAKFLIENGAPVNGSSGEGATPLVIALKNKDLPFAEWLLDHGADPNACGVGDDAALPLQVAMTYHGIPTMQMLFDRGAKPDVQDNKGETTLHLAVKCSRTDAVSWLIDRGANLHLKNKYGKTPLLCATEGYNSRPDCADVLIARDPDLMRHWNGGQHAIHYAAKHHEGERTVIRLLQYGVPARLEDQNGHTPLYYAAHEGNGTAEALIYAGALKDATPAEIEQYKKRRTKGKEGYEYWHWDIPALITKALPKSGELEKGAVAVARKTQKPLSAIDQRMFMMLQRNGSGDCAGDLIKQGASLHARNDAGQTPLIFACMNGASDSTCEYLAKSSDLLAVDDNGMTALHYAVQHVEMASTVRYLVDHGADVDAQDKIYGRTALMFATKGGNYLDFLMKHDADIELTDKLGLNVRKLAKLHRCKYSEEKIAEVEKAAKTKPRRKRTKPVSYSEGSRSGYGSGYRFGDFGGW